MSRANPKRTEKCRDFRGSCIPLRRKGFRKLLDGAPVNSAAFTKGPRKEHDNSFCTKELE
jgi:hypothetical protein